jgi:hypothetical protein
MAKNTKEKKKPLKKGQSSFNFIGEVKINDFTYKIDEKAKDSDWVYNQLNLGVDCGSGNTVYCELMGGFGSERDNVLYVHGIKKNENDKDVDDFENRFQIAWEDRFDEEVLETIGEKCFITIGLEKDKKDKIFGKKFLSAYDAIEYVKENLKEGTVVNIKGELKYSKYNDNVQVKKEIKSIFLSKVDDPTKYKATFTQSILIDRDSIGKLDKEKAVYPITCRVIDYAKMYNGKEVKQNIPFVKVFELEVDKAKAENTKKVLDRLLKVKSGITEIIFDGDILEGQSLVNITEDDLPDDIKDLIDMGVFTLEEAINKCAVGGSKEKRLILRKPVIKMVGDDDNKTPVIQKFEDQYEEDDLLLDCMLETEDTEEEEVKSKKSKASTKSKPEVEDEEAEDDDTDWLNALGEDD